MGKENLPNTPSDIIPDDNSLENNNPDGLAITPDPEATPDPITEPTPTPPAWSKGGKYKTPEDLANAYDGAVKEMHLTKQETALLRKELELVKQVQTNTSPSQNQVEEITDDLKAKIEAKYGNAFTFEQIKALTDIVSASVSPFNVVVESTHKNNYEMIKANLRQNDTLFKDYETDIVARLDKMSMSDRLNPHKIEEVRNKVISEHIPDIVAKSVENALKGVKGDPVNTQAVLSGNPPPVSAVKKPVLTKEQRDAIRQHGGNPDEVEKWAQNKDKEQKTGFLAYTE